LTFSASGNFTCNICGGDFERPAGGFGREVESCPACRSTVRVRGLIAVLSRELFGIALALPDFPALKGLRGFGMSDSPELAERLAAKFDYTNTFYHQAPRLDITQPPATDIGRYDFIISSEVMEHVPTPVERAFENLCRMLKPDGLLLLTVPYTIDGRTVEHFPQLHQYALAAPGGRTVLVNRRQDGALEIFENLVFHGGDGSTLEMRVFSEADLRETLRAAGFDSVEVASSDVPEFGVEHAETWSLPIAARKGRLVPPVSEMALGAREFGRRLVALERELATVRAEYQRYTEFCQRTVEDSNRQLTERAEWVRKVERDFEDRSRWAFQLEHERNDAQAAFERSQGAEAQAQQRVEMLEKELAETRAALAHLRMRTWTRVGRKLGAVE
jgi:SAM-dependent methyltransferase